MRTQVGVIKFQKSVVKRKRDPMDYEMILRYIKRKLDDDNDDNEDDETDDLLLAQAAQSFPLL